MMRPSITRDVVTVISIACLAIVVLAGFFVVLDHFTGRNITGLFPSPAPSAAYPRPTHTPRATSGGYTLALVPSSNTFTLASSQKMHRSGMVLKCGDFEADWSITESAGLAGTVTSLAFLLLEADGDVANGSRSEKAVELQAPGSLMFGMAKYECGYVGEDFPMRMRVTAVIGAGGGSHTLTAETGFVER